MPNSTKRTNNKKNNSKRISSASNRISKNFNSLKT